MYSEYGDVLKRHCFRNNTCQISHKSTGFILGFILNQYKEKTQSTVNNKIF